MPTYSVIAHDGKLYGPADENALVDWVREGRVDGQTLLFCHETNARLPAGSIPGLQPVLGLSPQQVSHLLQQPAGQATPGYPQQAYAQPSAYAQQPAYPPQAGYPQQPAYAPQGYPAGPIGYAGPATGYAGPAQHQLSEFPVIGSVLLSLFVPLFMMIYYGLAHGNLPKRRPDDPGAGKAIGFLFIPFFNLYWICFFWLRLCTRINDEQARAGLAPSAPRSLMVAILWTYLGMFIPFVNILAMLAIVVMLIIFLARLQGSINELVRATRRW